MEDCRWLDIMLCKQFHHVQGDIGFKILLVADIKAQQYHANNACDVNREMEKSTNLFESAVEDTARSICLTALYCDRVPS